MLDDHVTEQCTCLVDFFEFWRARQQFNCLIIRTSDYLRRFWSARRTRIIGHLLYNPQVQRSALSNYNPQVPRDKGAHYLTTILRFPGTKERVISIQSDCEEIKEIVKFVQLRIREDKPPPSAKAIDVEGMFTFKTVKSKSLLFKVCLEIFMT